MPRAGVAAFAIGWVALVGSPEARAEPTTRPTEAAPQTSVRPTLEPREQALGWWLTGSGVVGLAAGGFAMLSAGVTESGRTHDLQRGAGTALITIGAAMLATGVYLLAFDLPGPCETSGTAIDGPASGPASRPASRPSARIFFGASPTGLRIRGEF